MCRLVPEGQVVASPVSGDGVTMGSQSPHYRNVPEGQVVASPVSGDGVTMGSQSPHYRKVPEGQVVASPVSGDGVTMGSQSPHYRKVPEGQKEGSRCVEGASAPGTTGMADKIALRPGGARERCIVSVVQVSPAPAGADGVCDRRSGGFTAGYHLPVPPGLGFRQMFQAAGPDNDSSHFQQPPRIASTPRRIPFECESSPRSQRRAN